ncbi:MAG: hypothetical protein JSV19_09615 [Phycisphaerales bacterium]|nr:MAG: hypothetical protein JSV19_09615 [Phycisphaerales bacterium]
MNPQPHNLDPIEQMLLEADHAGRAGVFRRTPVDAAGLLAARQAVKASWFRRHHHALVGLPVAACLALVTVLGTLHYGGDPASDMTRVAVNQAAVPGAFDAVASQPTLTREAEVLFSCFTGPGQGPIPSECSSADYDDDGDVDLVDFGVFQLADNTGPKR